MRESRWALWDHALICPLTLIIRVVRTSRPTCGAHGSVLFRRMSAQEPATRARTSLDALKVEHVADRNLVVADEPVFGRKSSTWATRLSVPGTPGAAAESTNRRTSRSRGRAPRRRREAVLFEGNLGPEQRMLVRRGTGRDSAIRVKDSRLPARRRLLKELPLRSRFALARRTRLVSSCTRTMLGQLGGLPCKRRRTLMGGRRNVVSKAFDECGNTRLERTAIFGSKEQPNFAPPDSRPLRTFIAVSAAWSSQYSTTCMPRSTSLTARISPKVARIGSGVKFGVEVGPRRVNTSTPSEADRRGF